MQFQISILLISTVWSMLSVPALARAATVSCPGIVANNNGGTVWVTEQPKADVSGATFTHNGGANGGTGAVIDGNSEGACWGGGTFTGNQPIDVYCGAGNRFSAHQPATVGLINCPNPY